MARNFVKATPQYLYKSDAILEPITMAAWYKAASQPNTYMGIVSVGNNVGQMAEYVGLRYNSSGVYRAVARDWYSGTMAVATTNYSTGIWQHICGVFASANSKAVYMNGGNKGTDSNASNFQTSNRTSIGCVAYTFAGPFDGDIAEAGIWDVALTDDEVLALANGYSPLMIRPESLWMYAPLVRHASRDLIDGGAFTEVNSPGVSDHPRIIYPGMR